MSRRRRSNPPTPSPLIEQGFPKTNSQRALIQVVREVHAAHDHLYSSECEGLIDEAIRRARAEREPKEES